MHAQSGPAALQHCRVEHPVAAAAAATLCVVINKISRIERNGERWNVRWAGGQDLNK